MNGEKVLSSRSSALIRSVIFIAAGALLLFVPNLTTNMIFSAAGVLFLLYGVIAMLLVKGSNRSAGKKIYGMSSGMICLIIGIILLVFKAKLLNIVPVIFGVIILFNGIVRLRDCYDARRFNASKWWINLLMALIPIAFAMLLIFRSSLVMKMQFMIIGISLIVDGVAGLISSGYIKGVYRGYRRTVNPSVYKNTFGSEDIKEADVVDDLED